MFSRRLQWDQSRNRISERLEAYRQTGKPLLDLTGSNPTHAGFAWPSDLLAPLADERALAYDPDPRGLLSAREAVADYQQCSTDQVLLTASTSEAYSYLFKLLADAGEEILAPRPSYPLFDFLAALELVRIVPYPLFYDHGWSIDMAALEEAITDRTRAIVVVNPNNPTGSYLRASELAALERLCARHDLALISDEVFADFALTDGDSDRLLSVARGVDPKTTAFSLGGLSKACALPQLKLGWIVSNSPAALGRLELIADTYLSVSTPVQMALPKLLAGRHEIQRQILERLRANRQRVPGALAVEGGWTAVIRVPRLESDEEFVLRLLDEEGVLVQPGFFYDFPTSTQAVVVSLLTPEADFAEGSQRMEAAVNRLLRG
ncbi:MAG TPA: pyridoxal phosphate-dependent aminotransferase [Bryobacteraceae bacterium]